MKKAILFVLCSILLLGCLTAAHADQQETQDTNAVDIVLLIDQSGSLWKTNSPSDPNGYRLDAAQMIIAMLSQDNGSRVAYVPFSGKVFESADKHFSTINCEDDYLDKMRQSEFFRSQNNAAGPKNENDYGTDYAEALAYACRLLDNREDKTNKPMIILLTDGAMEIKDEVDKNGQIEKRDYIRKPYYQYNWTTKSFDKVNSIKVYAKYPGFNDNDNPVFAADLLKDVKEHCSNIKHYPIYTVALTMNEAADKDYINTLKDISDETNAKSFVINGGKNGAGLSNLPEQFGKMFAEQIGSTEPMKLQPRLVEGTENEYEVVFIIPNSSVQEANLYVSLENIESPRLYTPSQNLADNSSFLKLGSKNFVLYKMIKPTETGPWRFTFTAKNGVSPEAIKNISLNILYNYDMSLIGNVTTQDNTASETNTFSRGDALHFTGSFYNNTTGEHVRERNLYSYPLDDEIADDDWCEIVAKYTLSLKELHGTLAQPFETITGPMQVNADNGVFYLDLDMRTLMQDEEGYNTIPAGEYELQIDVKGSGMQRSCVIPFVLENTAPSEGHSSISIRREVNGTNSEWHLATPRDESIEEYITDEDGDKITLSYQKIGTNAPLLNHSKLQSELKFISTPSTDNTGKPVAGKEDGQLTITDSFGGKTTLHVTYDVIDLSDALIQNLTLKVTADGQDTGYIAQKDSDVAITLQLRNADGSRPAVEQDAEKITSVKLSYQKASDNIEVNDIELTKDVNDARIYTANLKTGLNEDNWKVDVSIYQHDRILKTQEIKFSVENTAPTAKSNEVQKLTVYYNPLPEFLSFIAKDSSEEERTLVLSDYFNETDNEPNKYDLVQKNDPSLLTITEGEDNNHWLLTAVDGAAGKTTFSVKATDNDGAQSSAITFEIELVDLTELWIKRGLFILATVVALVILFLVIRQIRKPKFPRGAILGVREGNSDYDTNSYELVPSKKPISLAAVVMTDTASKFGINANALTNILLTPMRSTNGSIGIRLNKKLDDVAISLDSQTITKNKKAVRWTPGNALRLSGRTNTTGSELNVLLYAPDVPTLASSTNQMADPFANSLQNDGFNSSSDAFGPNDVNGSWSGLTHTDSFSAPVSAEETSFSLPDTESPSSPADFFSSDDNNSTEEFTGGF